MLSVRSGGKDAGVATPHHITRHAHPKARPEPLPGDDIPRATGIDYLALLGDQHDKRAARPGQLRRPRQPAARRRGQRRPAAAGGGRRFPWMTSGR